MRNPEGDIAERPAWCLAHRAHLIIVERLKESKDRAEVQSWPRAPGEKESGLPDRRESGPGAEQGLEVSEGRAGDGAKLGGSPGRARGSEALL